MTVASYPTTILRVYDDGPSGGVLHETQDSSEIARLLAEIGVRFELWSADVSLDADASQEDILNAYAPQVERLQREGSYAAADVIRLKKGAPDTGPMREKFLNEHAHSEDEVRFFVEGKGAFYLRANGKVYQTICVRGDLISVPAGTKHWFDMGPAPEFTAIRLFTNPRGLGGQFYGRSDRPALSPPRRLMRLQFACDAAVTDIEGTVGSIAFVRETLFPYAREQLAGFVREHRGEPVVETALNDASQSAGINPRDEDALVQTLRQWIDEDRKATSLKGLQGLIWARGYEEGTLRAHLYDDAADALRVWRSSGIAIYVYSSGSIDAQRLFFTHSVAGNLANLFDGYFDTSVGGKPNRRHTGRSPSRSACPRSTFSFFPIRRPN